MTTSILEALIAPYNVTINTLDRGIHGRERLEPGCFTATLRSRPRTPLLMDHQHGWSNKVGYLIDHQDLPDGLYGTFKVYDAELPKVREAAESTHPGISVGFSSIRTRLHEGVAHREILLLDHISMVTEPAYAAAKVIRFREPEPADTAPRPPQTGVSPELAEIAYRFNADQIKRDLAKLEDDNRRVDRLVLAELQRRWEREHGIRHG